MTWKEQLRRCITTPEQIADLFDLDPQPLQSVARRYPLRITPYYFSLIREPGDPIWLQCVPDVKELDPSGLPEDSLNEKAYAPTPALVHRYPDRALLLVSGECAGYCRFCTRKHRVGRSSLCFSPEQIDESIAYLKATPQIRDVILTGGDPLLLEDDQLGDLLSRIQNIRHVDIIRIGSRVPVTLPDRITKKLCRMLRHFQPLYVNTHFNHPRELTQASSAACAQLADAGLVLGNQTVLLHGVNDNAEIMAELCRGLLKIRVRPYYLHHLDQTLGTAHFRVPVECGLGILDALRGRVSGLGIPQYVIDPPGGEGKVPLLPENLVETGEFLKVKTSCGIVELPNFSGQHNP